MLAISYKANASIPFLERPQNRQIIWVAFRALEFLSIALLSYYAPLLGFIALAAAVGLDKTISKTARDILDPPPPIATTAEVEETTFQRILTAGQVHMQPIDQAIADCTAIKTIVIIEAENQAYVIYGKDRVGHLFILIRVFVKKKTSRGDGYQHLKQSLGYFLLYKDKDCWHSQGFPDSKPATKLGEEDLALVEKLLRNESIRGGFNSTSGEVTLTYSLCNIGGVFGS